MAGVQFRDADPFCPSVSAGASLQSLRPIPDDGENALAFKRDGKRLAGMRLHYRAKDAPAAPDYNVFVTGGALVLSVPFPVNASYIMDVTNTACLSQKAAIACVRSLKSCLGQ